MAMKDNTSEFAARRSRMVKQQFDRHGLHWRVGVDRQLPRTATSQSTSVELPVANDS
jgi:hypothetical protein